MSISIFFIPIIFICLIELDRPTFRAGECSKFSKIFFFFNVFFEREKLWESKINGIILFLDFLFKIKKPVPLGPLKYFLPEPTIASQLIFLKSISI